MPRHNCSHMERFFRNVKVLFPEDHNGNTEEIWFWTVPAKHVRPGILEVNPETMTWMRNAHWDARFYNDGNKTPVQRWSFYQATGGRLEADEDEMTPRGWKGDNLKIYLKEQSINLNLGEGIHEYCVKHDITTPYVINPRMPNAPNPMSGVWWLNPEYKVVSPWHLTHNKTASPLEHPAYHELQKTPLKPALHMPEITDHAVRNQMMRLYAQGRPDWEVERMLRRSSATALWEKYPNHRDYIEQMDLVFEGTEIQRKRRKREARAAERKAKAKSEEVF